MKSHTGSRLGFDEGPSTLYSCFYCCDRFATEPEFYVCHCSVWSATCIRKMFFFSFFLFMYVIQHCFICLPSDSTASVDAGTETRTVATLALTARRSDHSAKSHSQLGKISSTVWMRSSWVLRVWRKMDYCKRRFQLFLLLSYFGHMTAKKPGSLPLFSIAD